MKYKLVYDLTEDFFIVEIFDIIKIILFVFFVCIAIYTYLSIYKKTKQLKEKMLKLSKVSNVKNISYEIKKNNKKLNTLKKILVIFILINFVYSYVTRYNSILYFNNNYKKPYLNNNFQKIEGKVEKIAYYKEFHIFRTALPGFSFYINDIEFCCEPDYDYGYNPSFKSEENYIKQNKQQVKIGYIYDKIRKINIIVKLEVLEKNYTNK